MHSKIALSILFFIVIYLLLNVTVLSLIGFYAIHYWCIENFESIIRIGVHICRKYLLQSKDLSLKEKYGDWAGVFTVHCSAIIL